MFLIFCPLVVLCVDRSCLQLLLLWYLTNGDFLFLSFLLHLWIRILLQERAVLSPLVFIYFFKYLFISVWIHGYLFYSIGYNPKVSLFIFLLKFPQTQLLVNCTSWLLCLFKIPLSFFEHFLIFWHQKMVHMHFVFSLPRNQPFSKKTLVSFSREWYLETKTWLLDKPSPIGYSLLPGPLSEQR